MLKKIVSALFSTRLMAVLFIVFAVAMAAGTFIENDYNTDTARIWVYNTWWFEGIMFMFMVNFIGNIKRYRLWSKEKWSTLLLHLAFILIIVGAFITRYISYEGMMPIREGATENTFYSESIFLSVMVDGMHDDGKNKPAMARRVFEKKLLLSPVADNSFTLSNNFDKKDFSIRYKKYIMGATDTIIPKPNGSTYLKMVEAGDGERHEHYLKEGEVTNIHNLLYSLNKFTPGAINISTVGNQPTVQMPFDGQFMRMADKMQGSVKKDSVQPLMFRSLYTVGEARFVFPVAPVKGEMSFRSNGKLKDKQSEDALILEVESGGKKQEVTLTGSRGRVGAPLAIKLNDLDFTLSYGSKGYQLPFTIKLNDFIASKYPGTEKSYSAYESQVTVTDGADKFDTRIYMNHVLDHKGYRFFQASFDPDEKGTILSVNHDFWGTWITYVGYFFLFAGLLAILFTKGSRFGEIGRKLDAVRKKKAKPGTTIILLLLSLGLQAQHEHEESGEKPLSAKEIDSLLNKYKVSEAHAAKFGRLIIQDEGGRMKPVNTFSSELLRKVSKSDEYKGLNSDQVFLSMTQFRTAWLNIPIIYLARGNERLRKIIGIGPEEKYASFISFFDAQGNYKLSPYLDDAYRASVPDKFQQDFIDTDRRVNLMNSALFGSILRLFPIPGSENNKWVSYLQLNEAGLKGQDSVFTKNILPIYLNSLYQAETTGDYKGADFYLSGISKYQHRYGKAVMPSDERVDSEILYNKYDVFKRLFYLYMTTGILMLFLTIVNIFLEKKWLKYIIGFFHGVTILLFIFHSVGLVARSYISGHAPWSDAYEAMIYVGWATMIMTLIFGRKSALTVASGTLVASMILMIAHWNWMDPAIANLQPVLDSYWLMIHVAVIVGSYGPFTLGMVLGAVSLILMLFINKNNRKKMELHLQELTYINEMTLTIGLVMLTIGNFLGGQWANESWGRYWGWDPKETWALVSIMVYAFVIHMRLVPGMRSKWLFNFVSVLAYYSILMTFFGVNFYLSGKHSYASGDKVVTPAFIYWSLAIVGTLGLGSWLRYRQNKNIDK
ncbi:cytochrome c biogenesis protein CcsA [Flavobacterium silvaticum]|uniref:Cytochrome c biogenesis protein CcsA n=1 Tax=Flavobacterium silvaticum TaxID=1852020 RepID=A0A972JGD4_9FLAO|nr:cytochrome c biogenesis protein CcsA [Flavobacterium silvaticum]NMH28934.1 cytochrome c biogenesis protein CcsA [Flavobacterium silvaticum]